MSAREIEVLNLIIQGLAGKEIASKLRISLNTVRSHKARIFRKLGVSSTTDAVRWMLQQDPEVRVARGDLAEHSLNLLTKREREVVLLLADGLTRDEIGWCLSISIYTVRRHLAHAFQKLRVHNGHAVVSLVLGTTSIGEPTDLGELTPPFEETLAPLG